MRRTAVRKCSAARIDEDGSAHRQHHRLGARPVHEALPARPRQGKAAPITKEAIFHYVYGVLHDPVYREKYALNLKREFPRIPFYAGLLAVGRLGRGADGPAHRLRDGRAVRR